MRKIDKYESLIQKVQYSKAYRAPLWLFKKLMYRRVDSTKLYQVQMGIGHQLKLRPTQNYLKSVIFSGHYHDENVFFLKKLLKSNCVILDIGANIGLYSCAYAQYFNNLNPKIFAIEAVENNFKLLNINIRLNHFEKMIQTDHIALGKEDGELEFVLPSEDFVGNAVGSDVADTIQGSGHIVKVAMTTLDHYAQKNNITQCDFIKIDIEGAEFFVFEGGKNFISKTRPVIQAEFNKYWVNKVGLTFKNFADFFLPMDYCFGIERSSSIEMIEDPLTYEVTDHLVDIYFIPKEKLSSLNPQ